MINIRLQRKHGKYNDLMFPRNYELRPKHVCLIHMKSANEYPRSQSSSDLVAPVQHIQMFIRVDILESRAPKNLPVITIHMHKI